MKKIVKTLTKRQKEILDFIRDWIAKKGYSPSFREVMHHFNYASLGTVVSHLKALIQKGYLHSEAKRRRSLVPAEKENSPLPTKQEIELPFVGMVQASFPIEMYPETKTFLVPSPFVRFPEITYVLQVQGESLLPEHMQEGDLLIVEARREIEASELIIASSLKQETLICRYFPEGDFIRLQGAVTPPLFLRYDELTIHGAIVGLIRSYR